MLQPSFSHETGTRRAFTTVLAVGERFNFHKYWRPALPQHDLSFELRLRLGFYRDANNPRRRMLSSLGVTWDDGINLLWPSPVTGEWDTAEAKQVAVALMPRVLDYSAVLLFGARVCAAFGVPFNVGQTFEMQEEYSPQSTLGVPLPHPSGCCRMWNDPAVRATVRQLSSWTHPVRAG